MKKYAIALALIMTPILSRAEAEGEIAIVDGDAILQSAKAVEELYQQVAEVLAKLRAEFQSYETTLRTEGEALMKDKNDSSKAAEVKHKKADFDKKVAAIHHRAETKRKQVEQILNEALLKVRDKIAQITHKIAKERKFKTVLLKSAVVYQSSNALDITQEVKERLQKELPHVALKLPKDIA